MNLLREIFGGLKDNKRGISKKKFQDDNTEIFEIVILEDQQFLNIYRNIFQEPSDK